MRYYINFDKLVNQLTPYYLGGRKLILYLQATVFPLRALNDRFVEWANETRIAASMTSQIFLFEWYLNRMFGKYYANSEEKLTIKNGVNLGVPIFNENADVAGGEHVVLYGDSENALENTSLYFYNEKTDRSSHSFVVYAPHPNTAIISNDAYIAMLNIYINRYRLSGKTYIIKIA